MHVSTVGFIGQISNTWVQNYPEVFSNVTKGAELKLSSIVMRIFKLKVVQYNVILSHLGKITAHEVYLGGYTWIKHVFKKLINA